MTPLADALRHGRFVVRMRLGRHPPLHHVVAMWNWLRVRDDHARVTARTALVIDGFPSSGNSFAIAALRAASHATGRPLPAIAHHLHCAGQVLDAARRGIPVLLLVRDPRATTASSLSRWPHLRPSAVLRAYDGYYRTLLPVAESVEVATFDQLTTECGLVIERLNRRYGLTLPVFDPSTIDERVVYDPDDPARMARRQERAARLGELRTPALAPLVDRARATYDDIVRFHDTGA